MNRGLSGRAAALAAAALWTLGFTSPLEAATCGGEAPCACGAEVQGSATLDRDLIDCGRVGLRLASGAKLDCAGHQIQGLGKEKSKYGIVLDKASDAEVRGCTVSGFERGIRVRGGKAVKIEKNTLRDNQTGIETAGASKSGPVEDPLIADNLLERNERNGVHLGAGTVRARVMRNRVEGMGKEKSKYGIVLDKVSDAEVRGCTVSGYERGIRVRGGKGAKIEKNTVHDNQTGIETAGASKRGQVQDALIADNLLEHNELDGVHLGVGTLRPRVTRNRFVRNGQESLNLCECVQCEITENLVEDSGNAGIYARNVKGAYFADNVLRRSFFYVRGDSAHNVLARNILDSGFFLFGGYTGRGFTNDPGWVKVPHDNEIIGGAVKSRKYCFRFHGASHNRVRGTVTHGCQAATSKPYGELEPEGNVLNVREAGADFDSDGVANVSDPCTDVDGDGFGDPGFQASTCERDNCPETKNPDQADRDGDGFGDACDVCPDTFDPAQIDRNHDGVGDSCAGCVDADGDGRATGGDGCPGDNCPQIANADQSDFDQDGIGDACDPCPYLAEADQQEGSVCGVIVPASLDADRAGRFRRGARAFTRIESPASGLGPGFNGRGCAECHGHPTVGGSSARLVTLYGKLGADGFDPLDDLGGPALQAEGIRTPDCSAPTEGVPLGAMARHRQATALYGLGRIEAIPESAIVARADPDDADGDGVSGRVNHIDGQAGRFGWKADEATIEAMVAKALQREIGITTPLRPTEEKRVRELGCDPVADPEDDGTHLRALVEFLRFLPPLPEGARGEREERGGALFRESGCASCHVPELPAGDGATPGVTAVPLYSDLLLHDMGAYLGDGITAGDAQGNEFRTAPLWGVGASKPYLHDGRAETLEAAIGLHGGEATRAREKYLALPAKDRKSLVAFLESL